MRTISSETQYEKMTLLVNEFLPLNQWGFAQIESLPGQNYRIAFDSEWCRIKIMWDGWDVYVGDMISIYYGRRHAPIEKNVITWNGEECYCWHRINEPLFFLDGLSPIDAVELYMNGQLPKVMSDFSYSELGQSLVHKQPEWLVRTHAAIWKHYGQRLFGLFDLRNSHLWEEYSEFLKIYYEIKGPIEYLVPPEDKIC